MIVILFVPSYFLPNSRGFNHRGWIILLKKRHYQEINIVCHLKRVCRTYIKYSSSYTITGGFPLWYQNGSFDPVISTRMIITCLLIQSMCIIRVRETVNFTDLQELPSIV